MKCQFCGKTTDKLFCGPNDIALCDDCNKAYESNKKNTEDNEMAEVIDMKKSVPAAEFIDVPEEEIVENVKEQPAEVPVRCEIVVGVLEDGRLYFNVGGKNADLLVIDGLIKYAERRMKLQWDIRDVEFAKAAQEQAGAPVQEVPAQ